MEAVEAVMAGRARAVAVTAVVVVMRVVVVMGWWC